MEHKINTTEMKMLRCILLRVERTVVFRANKVIQVTQNALRRREAGDGSATAVELLQPRRERPLFRPRLLQCIASHEIVLDYALHHHRTLYYTMKRNPTSSSSTSARHPVSPGCRPANLLLDTSLHFKRSLVLLPKPLKIQVSTSPLCLYARYACEFRSVRRKSSEEESREPIYDETDGDRIPEELLNEMWSGSHLQSRRHCS